MEEVRIPTGSTALDSLLGGGVQSGSLSLLYGASGSGKTTVALSVAAGLLKESASSGVVWVDSDGKFTPVRLDQLIGASRPLRRLLYAHPSTFEGQAEAIDRLPDQLHGGDLAVIDSVTGLYRVELGDSERTFMENKELNRQLGELKEIALSLGVAVLVTGQVRSVLDSQTPDVEPVAQRLLRYWSDLVIRLDSTATQAVRQASIEKPERMRGAVRFRITQSGLEEA